MTTVVNIDSCPDFDPANNSNDVYVGKFYTGPRGFFPKSKWHNPYPETEYDRSTGLEAYRNHILQNPELLGALPELKEKRLGCWCKPRPCHADVLVQLVNELA
jgi:hypothetical protein